MIYREPVRDPVPDAGFEGKSLILKDILLDFFHKFIRFRLPIKNARVSGQGGIPGIFQSSIFKPRPLSKFHKSAVR